MFETEYKEARVIAKEIMKAHSLSGMAIEIAIVLIVVAVLIGGIAFPIFFGTNTTGWGATNILVWGVIPTVAIAAVIIGLVKHYRGGSGE
jgi:hypothetical protein